MTLQKNLIREKAHTELSNSKQKKIPINLEKIVGDANIKLIKEELDNEISGVLKITDDGKATILVNASHHPNRQRFSIAHELGHYFLHHRPGIHVDKEFRRNSASGEGLHSIEIEANRFASELLMPDFLVEKEIKNVGGFLDTDDEIVEKMAKKFEVSTMAMSIKLHELGYTP